MPREYNFDGLVGPTHNYAGLAFGNVASAANAGATSNPRQAALEGLDKMAALAALGVPQGVLPPQERPRLDVLAALGFGGADPLGDAHRQNPYLLAAVWSASAMWAANAAIISPSDDTRDGRVHVTPANLITSLHRSLEPNGTARMLRRIFAGEHFVHHPPLPATRPLSDEGAANHIRLHDGRRGLAIFVYGRSASEAGSKRFPARQTREACEAIARSHGLSSPLMLQQTPSVIDAGVFHNDVISVGHERVLFRHETAFADPNAFEQIGAAARELEIDLVDWCVSGDELSVAEAVRTYLFNSQIVTTASGWVLVAPLECSRSDAARSVIERLKSEGLADVRYLDVRQSMRNGGGPACLRLRVQLTAEQEGAVHAGCVFDEALHGQLRAWVQKHYRDQLCATDLRDRALIGETHAALDELTNILDLGSAFYDFQR